MTISELASVERKIIDEKIAYCKSAECQKWGEMWVKREMKKARENGVVISTRADVQKFLYEPNFKAKYDKAFKKHLAHVEKKIRAKYAGELKALAIIRKIPRYDGKKIVIDI